MSALPGQYFIINKLNPHCLITASLQMSGSHTALQTPMEKTEVEMCILQMHTGYKFGLWHFLLSNLQKVFTKASRTPQIHIEPRYQQKKILITCFCGKKGPQLGCVLLCCSVQLCMRQLLGVIFLLPFLCFTWLFMPHSCSQLDDTAS